MCAMNQVCSFELGIIEEESIDPVRDASYLKEIVDW